MYDYDWQFKTFPPAVCCYFRYVCSYSERQRIVVHTEKFSMFAQVDQLNRFFPRSVGQGPLYHRTTGRSDQATQASKNGKKKPRAPGNHETKKFRSIRSFQTCFERNEARQGVPDI